MVKISENQIKEYVSSYISKSGLDVAVSELYWILNKDNKAETLERVDAAKQNILDFCERNDIK